MTTPAIITQCINNLGSQRTSVNVAQHFQKVAVVVNKYGLNAIDLRTWLLFFVLVLVLVIVCFLLRQGPQHSVK